MSFKNYQEAVTIIEKHKEKCFFAGSQTEELIYLAEKKIGLELSGIYREFLLRFGAGSFGAEEVYGVVDEDFENSSVPDAIWYTLTERKEINFPKDMLIIYDTGNEEFFCLDYRKVNESNEPTVVSFFPGVDLEKQDYRLVAKDFGDFLLDIVRREV